MIRHLSFVFVLLLLLGALSCSSDSPGPTDTGGNPPPGGGGGGGGGDESGTSGGLIDDAVQKGEIDTETGLMYKMFALYKDSRLPVKYTGDDALVKDSGIKREVIASFDQLSPATQDVLYPFLVQPFYKGSWYDLRAGGGQNRSPGQPCLPWIQACDVDGNWQYVDGAGGKVRVWYHKDHQATDQVKASHVASELEGTIWPALTALMDNNEPVPDGTLQNNGGNGRFDLVLVDINDYGVASPIVPQSNPCDQQAVYLEISRHLTGNVLDATVAHEFMHAIQYGYKSACWERAYWWMDEATATWSEHFVYPNHNTEHEYAEFFLNVPEKSLDSNGEFQRYGAYLFFFYLHESFNSSWISKIYNAATIPDPLQAIENGLTNAGSTNFKERWPEFARRNWNQVPAGQYNNWDQVAEHAKKSRDILRPALTASPDDTLQMPVDLPHLSAQYYHVMFTSENVRTVLFMNGLKYKLVEASTPEGLTYFEPETLPEADTKGVNVQILYRVAGQDWVTKDVTEEVVWGFCRDQLAGRVEEMVVIFSNSDITNPGRTLEAKGFEPFLWFSNVGCWKWQGSVTYAIGEGDCATITMQADAAFETGWEGFGAGSPPPDAPEEMSMIVFEAKTGTYSWAISGGDCDQCTVSGNATWPVPEGGFDFLTLYDMVPSGPFQRSFRISGFAQDAGYEVTEAWKCPEPEGNFDFTYPLDFYVDLDAPDHGLKLSADGSQIFGTVDDGYGYVYRFNLTAQRQ